MDIGEMISKWSSGLGTYVIGPALMGVGAWAIMKWSEYRRGREKSYAIKITAEKNERIQELLIELRVKLKADRTYLAMFHNGSKYVDNSEILKYSRVSESVGPGVSFEAESYQNIKTSLMYDEMKLATDEGPSFTLAESLKDGKFKRLLIGAGVRSIGRCPVKKGEETIGFLGVDFNDLIESPTNIVDLCNYSGIIEQVLSSYKDR